MAEELVDILAQRGSDYGPFSGHAKAAQELKQVVDAHLKTNINFDRLTANQKMVVREALDMIMHKVGRIVNGDALFEDSWVDIAGYAKLVPIHAPKTITHGDVIVGVAKAEKINAAHRVVITDKEQ